MAEQNNQNNGNDQGNNSGQNERTFTQAELDNIVKSRLAEETKKYASYKEKAEKYDEQQEAAKSDLQKANERADSLQAELDKLKSSNALNQTRDKVSKETGVPVELLTGEDEESCKAQADAILKFARPTSYPGTKKNRRTSSTNSSGDSDEAMREFARSIFKGE